MYAYTCCSRSLTYSSFWHTSAYSSGCWASELWGCYGVNMPEQYSLFRSADGNRTSGVARRASEWGPLSVELFTTPSPPGSPHPQMLLWC